MSHSYTKPLPVPSPESRPFWEALRHRELRLQQCRACGQWWFPPGNLCPNCLSEAWDWALASGQGSLISFVVMHRAYHPGFSDELPYNVAVVELAEGPRMVSNVIGCANEDLAIGMPLEVIFDAVTDEVTLPKFRPR